MADLLTDEEVGLVDLSDAEVGLEAPQTPLVSPRSAGMIGSLGPAMPSQPTTAFLQSPVLDQPLIRVPMDPRLAAFAESPEATPEQKRGIGYEKGLREALESMTTPKNLALMAASGGVAKLGPLAARAVAAAWSAVTGKQVSVDIAKALGEEYAKPPDKRDQTKIGELIAQGAATAGISALAGASVGRPIETPASVAAEMLRRNVESDVPPVIPPRPQPIVSSGTIPPPRPGIVTPDQMLELGALQPPLPPGLPRLKRPPVVPETPPEPAVGITAVEEEKIGRALQVQQVQRANARTTAEVQKLFPEMNRQQAAQLRRESWGEPSPVQDLRPAVKTMDGEIVEGDKGQTHNEIIKQESIPATDVDRREFVDTKTGQEVSREQVATAIPTERPGEAHSTDLTEAQKAEEQARLAAELEPTTPKDLALKSQREAGWNPEWPFVPADFGNPTFREAIESDPSISAAEKDKMFGAAEKLLGGKLERKPTKGTEQVPTEGGHTGEKVTAAAIKINGEVATGADHAEAVMNYANKHGMDQDAVWKLFEKQEGDYYGFVTDKGRFIDLDEAARLSGKQGKASHAAEILATPKPTPPSTPKVAEPSKPQPAAEAQAPASTGGKAIPKKPKDVPDDLWANEPARTAILQHEHNIKRNAEQIKQLNAQIQPLLVERGTAEALHKGSEAQRRMGGLGPNALKAYRLKQQIDALREQTKNLRDRSAQEKKLRDSFIASWESGKAPPPTPPASPTTEAGAGPLPGPGAQTAGEPKYAAIQQLTDQLNAAKPVGVRERLSAREKLADAWAEGKSLVDRAIGRSRAVSQTVKEMARGVRDVTDLDRKVGTLDYLLQRSAGQSIANGNAIKRQMRNRTMREAVALWIDANGDEAAIQRTLDNLKDTVRPNVRRALEAATNLPPEAKQFAESLKQFFGIREQDAIASDIFEKGLEDYFTHIWQKETNMPDSMRAAVTNGRVSDYFQFARKRRLSTFLEGIDQGKNPILDPAKVVPYYNYALDRAIASREFIKSLSELDAPDGRPAVLPSGTAVKMGSIDDPTGMAINPRGKTELGKDYRVIDHPALRKWKWIGKDENGNPIMYRSDLAVNPQMYERLARMLDRGRMTPTEWGRRALRASTEVKAFKLGLLSAFHQVHVGSHALWHWTLPFGTKPIDWDSPAVRFAVEQGHLKIAADPSELAHMSEGILGGGSSLVQKIPAIGPWAKAYSEWLFGDYIPRLKLKTFENAYDRNLKWYAKDIASGKETPETVAARVGDSINNAYGELNHWFLGKYGRDPRFQRLLRGIFLAPDFGEARLRFVEKAFTKMGNEERMALATMFVTMYTASRVGNWLSHGDPEWEPKNMFRIKVGSHWITARSVVGDVAHALTDASQFMYVRLNPLYARTASDMLFRRDVSGRKLSWTDVLLKRPAEQLIPIQFSNLTRDDQHLWESFISSMGLQSRHELPQGDVRHMVRKFLAASNDPKLKERADRLDQEIFAPSAYSKLRTALRDNNQSKAKAEYQKLLKTRSSDQIFKYMDQTGHPYSGSWEIESDFVASLTPKEREAYSRARQEQAIVYQRFVEMASQPER